MRRVVKVSGTTGNRKMQTVAEIRKAVFEWKEETLVEEKKMNPENMSFLQEDAKPEEKERCVLCWKETEYTKNTPIQDRQFYMEGAGQLCEECYKECLLEK